MVVIGAVDEDEDEEISVELLSKKFTSHANKTAENKHLDIMKPLWQESEGKEITCRLRWAKKLDSTPMQFATLAFVFIDVVAVLLEILVFVYVVFFFEESS